MLGMYGEYSGGDSVFEGNRDVEYKQIGTNILYY